MSEQVQESPTRQISRSSRTSRYAVKGRIILQLKSPQANAPRLARARERNTTSNYRTRHTRLAMLDNADTFYLVSGGQAGGGTRERNVYDTRRHRCTFRSDS